jgi:hypothetical protein
MVANFLAIFPRARGRSDENQGGTASGILCADSGPEFLVPGLHCLQMN